MALQLHLVDDLPLQVSANASGGIAQYCAVVPDASGNFGDCIYPSGSGALAIGVSQSVGGVVALGSTTPPVATSGESIAVRIFGITKAIAAAAITIGALVSVSGASGQFGPAAAAGATNTYVVGMALTAAGAAGDVFTLLLFGPGTTTQINA